ncbi:MAG: DAK2 domain-containing protein [Turicibacter sp.]|nr:DAK2 domain-containing protein [Turicibacter sp.]
MSVNHINGNIFRQMVLNGANNLTNQSQYVNELNVFPVPDGDTGTNMSMTINAGAKELQNLEEPSIGKVAKILSRGLLMGARGNSGVILSQLFRGFAQGLEGKDEATIEDLAHALEQGVKTAYKAVMRPVEGTILTVARQSAEAGLKKFANCQTATGFYEMIIEEMKISLDGTPDLLPVLKEVGVVDSGGQGLVYIFEGFLKALKGETISLKDQSLAVTSSAAAFDMEHAEFGYCTEFILKVDPAKMRFKEDIFRDRLGKLGDSIVVVQDEDIVKVHVHTLTPGEALNLGQKHGEFLTLKIENMTEQHNEIIGSDQAHAQKAHQASKEKEFAIISVVAGEGIKQQFMENGADFVIEGGQTMNPSTEDFLKAIEGVNAKNIIILPNNSNIIMAANQAAEVTEAANVVVIPSKTIPQGYTALMMFNDQGNLEDNLESMNQALSEVKSGQVTYAVRDTSMNGVDIKENDFIGILDKEIVVAAKNRFESVCALADKMLDEDSELVTVFYGEGTDEDEAGRLAEYIESKFEDAEVTVIGGEQPVYSYILSVE